MKKNWLKEKRKSGKDLVKIVFKASVVLPFLPSEIF
jgi:hypothetical protein